PCSRIRIRADCPATYCVSADAAATAPPSASGDENRHRRRRGRRPREAGPRVAPRSARDRRNSARGAQPIAGRRGTPPAPDSVRQPPVTPPFLRAAPASGRSADCPDWAAPPAAPRTPAILRLADRRWRQRPPRFAGETVPTDPPARPAAAGPVRDAPD